MTTRPHTHDSPRDVLVLFARAHAELARRRCDEREAHAYDALAAELRGPSDLATSTRLLADDYAEAGYVEAPDWLRAIAEIVDGRFPCGHEEQGPPIDGREVDRAPEDPRPQAVAMFGDFDVYRTPLTDDGAAVSPPSGTAPSSPHAEKNADTTEEI